eukprot:5291670-Pyramimonas_sp.AAC.2
MQSTASLGVRVGIVAQSRETRVSVTPARIVVRHGQRKASQISLCGRHQRCSNTQFADRNARYRSVCKASADETESSAGIRTTRTAKDSL